MERPARMTPLLILVIINGGGMIMKRIIYIGFAAIMAFAFSSCQKEAEIENVNENKLVKVVLRAEKAGETRTAAVESDSKVSYVWTDEDEANFRLYQVTTETTEQGTSEKYTAIENPTLTFSSDNRVLTVAAEVPASATLRAFVSGNWTNSATRPNPRLKVIQNPATDNFDPTADILVADDLVIPAGETEFNGTLKFNRPVTVNKMTLKGLANGETVSKVVLSSTNHLSGYYSSSNTSMTGDGKELTMQYSNVAVGSTGEFPVYFVAVPKEGHTLTVVVETSRGEKKYSYTKSFGSGNINFATGNFGKFSVNLAGLAEEVTDVDYSGEWIIAGTDGGHDLAATPWSSGYVYPASIVTLDPENEVVTVRGETDPYRMTITLVKSGDYAGLYTIEDENGAYLSATGGTNNNNLTGKDDPDETSYWSIEKNTDGTYNIIAAKLADDARKSMRVNYNSGNPRFTCYAITSGQPKVVLYPFENIEVDDTPAETFDFKKVTKVTSGKQYLLVAYYNSKYYSGLVNGSNYGYMQSEVVTPVSDIITVDDLTNAITIETSGSGYSMLQSNGKYIYANGSYNTLNYGATPTNTWTIEPQTDGTFKFTSIGTFIQFGQGNHTTFGRWSSAQTGAVMPYLYEYQGGAAKELVSIAVSDVTTTSFNVGDTFAFDGKVTATFSDESTEDVTASATVSSPDMTTAGTKTVTVSYEGKEATYSITVTESVTPTSKTVTLTNANIVAAGTGDGGYKLWSSIKDEENNTWSAYAIKNQHSNATSSYHFLQIKKYASNTAYYIQVPALGTKITKIEMTVSSSSKPMTGGSNTYTLFFSASNSTSAAGTGVASGTGASTVTINTSSLNLNSGYITASGSVRIWDVKVTYN